MKLLAIGLFCLASCWQFYEHGQQIKHLTSFVNEQERGLMMHREAINEIVGFLNARSEREMRKTTFLSGVTSPAMEKK